MLRAKQKSQPGWGRASALAFVRAVSVLTLTGFRVEPLCVTWAAQLLLGLEGSWPLFGLVC